MLDAHDKKADLADRLQRLADVPRRPTTASVFTTAHRCGIGPIRRACATAPAGSPAYSRSPSCRCAPTARARVHLAATKDSAIEHAIIGLGSFGRISDVLVLRGDAGQVGLTRGCVATAEAHLAFAAPLRGRSSSSPQPTQPTRCGPSCSVRHRLPSEADRLIAWRLLLRLVPFLKEAPRWWSARSASTSATRARCASSPCHPCSRSSTCFASRSLDQGLRRCSPFHDLSGT